MMMSMEIAAVHVVSFRSRLLQSAWQKGRASESPFFFGWKVFMSFLAGHLLLSSYCYEQPSAAAQLPPQQLSSYVAGSCQLAASNSSVLLPILLSHLSRCALGQKGRLHIVGSMQLQPLNSGQSSNGVSGVCCGWSCWTGISR